MKHFTLAEFTRSITASIKGYDNTPSEEVVVNLHWLVEEFLDPLREAIGSPICISSGYRCKDLNTAVGGAETSAHLLGLAADFYPLDPEKRQLILPIVRKWRDEGQKWKEENGGDEDKMMEIPKGMFNQFITYPTFFHVAVAARYSTQRLRMLQYNGYGQGYKKD
ncbi:MAG: hypothetical protein IKP91_11825 [Bacteroidaceae bacterium]|nr:hypothetical protein [Bacteroidaceae bacterium]